MILLYAKAILSLVRYLPAVVEAIQQGVHFIDLRIELLAYDKAAETAKNDKDTGSLEGLFDPKPTPGADQPK